jgi:hypothetical protein
MDVQSLRNYTRKQMDVDETDLPDTILNIYLQEAFDRTMAMTNQWPRTEATWSVSLLPGNTSVSLPPDLNIPGLISVLTSGSGYRLTNVNQEAAEMNFAPLSETRNSDPLYFSIWGSQMYLWPRVAKDDPYNLLIRGYRQPVWTNAASDIPDLDSRLHVTLAYFALSLAYAQQEDDVLEAAYLARWNRDLMQQLKTMMEPVHARPLVMHGGSPVGGMPSFVVIPPGS